jgi:hypothetical protein
VLNSERAIRVNIEIIRTFVRLRQMLASNAQLARKIGRLGEEIRRGIQSDLAELSLWSTNQSFQSSSKTKKGPLSFRF